MSIHGDNVQHTAENGLKSSETYHKLLVLLPAGDSLQEVPRWLPIMRKSAHSFPVVKQLVVISTKVTH